MNGGTGGGGFLAAAGEPLRKGFSAGGTGGGGFLAAAGGTFGGVGGCGTEGCHGEEEDAELL